MVSLGLGVVVWLALPSDDPIYLASMATGYVGLTLLVTTLVLGPVNVLRGKANPVSTDLRRDIGIWAGVAALAHVVVGLQVHQRGRMWRYFLYRPNEWSEHLVPLRYDTFGWANWTGLAAGLVFVLLLALSNDLTLRRLGSSRWKALQRWNYVGAGLVAVHAFLYQVIERRAVPWVALVIVAVVGTVIIQVAGYRRRRRPGPASRA